MRVGWIGSIVVWRHLWRGMGPTENNASWARASSQVQEGFLSLLCAFCFGFILTIGVLGTQLRVSFNLTLTFGHRQFSHSGGSAFHWNQKEPKHFAFNAHDFLWVGVPLLLLALDLICSVSRVWLCYKISSWPVMAAKSPIRPFSLPAWFQICCFSLGGGGAEMLGFMLYTCLKRSSTETLVSIQITLRIKSNYKRLKEW